MIIPVGPARNLASQAAFSSTVGFPLRSILGKKYKPSPGKEVRRFETICSSLDMRVKPMPLSSTMCEMPPHTNMVAAPASVAISHLCKKFIRSSIQRGAHNKAEGFGQGVHNAVQAYRCVCSPSVLRINLWRLFANFPRIDDEFERICVLILFHQLQIGEPLSAFERIAIGKLPVCGKPVGCFDDLCVRQP